MQAFTHLLSRTRLKINKWRHHGVNDIDSELIKTKPDIKALEESDLDLNSQHTLMELYNKLAALQRQCNTKWAQRARMLWVKDGDRNTLFSIISLVLGLTLMLFHRLLITRAISIVSNLIFVKLSVIFMLRSGSPLPRLTLIFWKLFPIVSPGFRMMIACTLFERFQKMKYTLLSSVSLQVSPPALMVSMLKFFAHFGQ